MKIAFKFAKDGSFIGPVEVNPNEKGEYILPASCTFTELPQPNWLPKYINGAWVETGDALNNIRASKLSELDKACNNAILADFEAQVDGVSYWFGHDDNAQKNFSSAKLGFLDGSIEDLMGGKIPWTAYDSAGNVVRLQLTKDTFDPVFRAHAMIAIMYIAKFRDTLEPLVNAAQSIEEINQINWE